MIIRDKETGKEYMIADLGGDGDHLSSQKLINLSTNETLVLQYDTLDPEQGSNTERSGSNARSVSSQLFALASETPGTASGRGTPREHLGDDKGSAGGAGAASPAPTKPKSKGVKAWGRKAASWCASCPPLRNSGRFSLSINYTCLQPSLPALQVPE